MFMSSYAYDNIRDTCPCPFPYFCLYNVHVYDYIHDCVHVDVHVRVLASDYLHVHIPVHVYVPVHVHVPVDGHVPVHVHVPVLAYG